MCIDKLVIKFQEPRGGFSRLNNSDWAGSDLRLIDLDDVRENLRGAGYALQERSSGSGRTFYTLLTVVNQNGESAGVVIKARGILSSSGDDYQYVKEIIANPSSFTRFSDFWVVIEAMDGDAGLITQRAYIHRIDYACDYLLPIQAIMQGLHVSRAQTLLAYDDFAEDDPYSEYRWNSGIFFSFKIGAGNRSLKIYDKGREELKRLRRLERRCAARLEETIANNDDEDDDYDDDDDDEDEDEDDTFDIESMDLSDQAIRQHMEGLRQNIIQYERHPRARIELSLNTPAVVRKAWGYGSGRPSLSDLHDHFTRISDGHFSPFRGVLLSTIDMRGADLENRTHEAIAIRHDVENGLLMNFWKRMGRRRFWAQHRRYFRIYPWRVNYQPTAIFKSRFWEWFSLGRGLTTLGALVPDNPHTDRPAMRSWPLESTYCASERMARQGRLPITGD